MASLTFDCVQELKWEDSEGGGLVLRTSDDVKRFLFNYFSLECVGMLNYNQLLINIIQNFFLKLNITFYYKCMLFILTYYVYFYVIQCLRMFAI